MTIAGTPEEWAGRIRPIRPRSGELEDEVVRLPAVPGLQDHLASVVPVRAGPARDREDAVARVVERPLDGDRAAELAVARIAPTVSDAAAASATHAGFANCTGLLLRLYCRTLRSGEQLTQVVVEEHPARVELSPQVDERVRFRIQGSKTFGSQEVQLPPVNARRSISSRIADSASGPRSSGTKYSSS